MDYKFQTPDGTEKSIKLVRQSDGSYQATIDGRSYTVTLDRRQPLQFHFQINGEPHLAYVARSQQTQFVWLDGQTAVLEKVTGGRRAKQAQSGDLTASMHGQVTQVLVRPGDSVHKGQSLVVMEAMKMEMRVKAPRDGQVKQVLCKVGDMVERGQLLVEVQE